MSRAHRAHGLRRAPQRRLAEFGGVGVTCRLAGDGAQPEALRGVEIRRFELPVVEREGFRLPVFEKEFAVVRAVQRVADDGIDPPRVHAGAGEENLVEARQVGHGRSPC